MTPAETLRRVRRAKEALRPIMLAHNPDLASSPLCHCPACKAWEAAYDALPENAEWHAWPENERRSPSPLPPSRATNKE